MQEIYKQEVMHLENMHIKNNTVILICTQTCRKKTLWSNHMEELCVDTDDNIRIKMAYFYAKCERLPTVILCYL
jgi:hypothetical protein